MTDLSRTLPPVPACRGAIGRWSVGLSLAAHAALWLWVVQALAVSGGPARPDEPITVDVIALAASEAEDLPEPPVVAPEPPPPEITPPPPEAKAEPKPEPAPEPKPAPKSAPRKAKPAPKPAPAAVRGPEPQPAPVATAPPPPAPAVLLGTRPQASEDSLRAYARTVWRLIERHKPPGGRFPGVAVLTFVIARDGSLTASAVTASSGSATLDQAALEALRDAAPFPAPPAEASAAQLTFTIPYQFR